MFNESDPLSNRICYQIDFTIGLLSNWTPYRIRIYCQTESNFGFIATRICDQIRIIRSDKISNRIELNPIRSDNYRIELIIK